jgi:predicted ribosome quality control (RQC) complex YloA/Tae2 family protein
MQNIRSHCLASAIKSMELSGIELRYMVDRIKEKVTSGYYVSNISAITEDSLLFRLHHPTSQDIMLVLSIKGLWITKLKFKQMQENVLETALKAEIERAKFESLEQMGSERIVVLRFRQLDGRLRIVIGEFFGEGNIVLCDESLQILAILRPIEVRHRTLKVGLKYAPPPSRGLDIFTISAEQLRLLRDKNKDLDILRWTGRNLSLPKKFVEEIAHAAGISPVTKAGQLSDEQLDRIYAATKELVERIVTEAKHDPVLIFADGKPQDALPIRIAGLEASTAKSAASYADAVDEVLSSDILEHSRGTKTVELDRQISVLEHDLEEQNKAKDQVLQKASAIRKLAGEFMSSLRTGIQRLDESSAKEILASNSGAVIRDKGINYLEVASERVRLDSNLNLAQIASMLYAKAKEMERGSQSIDEAKEKLLVQIDKLRTQTATIHKKIDAKQQVVREWYERYRWFITTDGLLAIGGRDASSNSALVRKHLTEHDIVFHAEVHGSPFFIVKNAAKQAELGEINQSLREVAQATVSFSRAWKDGLSSADAYWVMPEQVKKGAPTGQFLPKGSFVIEGKRNYLKGIELRLAIGIADISGKQALVCGPPDAIRKKCFVYAVLVQGGMDPMSAAKKVRSELAAAAAAIEQSEIEDFIKKISLDDYIRALPTGQSKISFSGKGEGRQEKKSKREAEST